MLPFMGKSSKIGDALEIAKAFQLASIGKTKKLETLLGEASEIGETTSKAQTIYSGGEIGETEETALAYAKSNEDKIINDYIEKHQNRIDPDIVRDAFKPIGYDGTNVELYRLAEKYIVTKVYKIMLDNAAKKGNKTITFLTGIGGSGKSNATKNLDLSEKGVIFDSALNSFESLDKVLSIANNNGFEIEVIPVYNDPITAYTNTINRGIDKNRGTDKNRFLPLSYFVRAFLSNTDKIRKVINKYPNVKIRAFDNTGNNTKEVGIEEAKTFEYDLTEPQILQLLKIIENEQRFTGNQIASVANGLRQITETPTYRTSEVERLIVRIENSVLSIRQREESSRVGADKAERIRLEDSDITAKPESLLSKEQGKASNIVEATDIFSANNIAHELAELRKYETNKGIKGWWINLTKKTTESQYLAFSYLRAIGGNDAMVAEALIRNFNLCTL